MRTYPEAGSYGSAADLYAGILAAALQSPDDDAPCLLPEMIEVPADHPHSLCTLQTVTTWNGGRRQWDTAFAEDLAGTAKCMAEVHGPQRPGGAMRVRFAYRSQGARCSLTVRGTRPRLLELADTVRKGWALFGGGPKPAELKPARRTVNAWPANIVRVWRTQLEDRDFVGALLTGERIGAAFYPGAKGCPIILAAPMPVDGLPDGLCSVRRDDGRWTVSDMQSGRAMGAAGYGSRKAAEAAALELWESKPEDWRSMILKTARDAAGSIDHAGARAEWCKARNIEDPAEPFEAAAVPDVPADAAPAPDLEPVPECLPAAAAAPADDVARAEAVAEFEAAAVDAHPLAVSADRIDRMRARAADRPDLAGFFAHAIGLHEASHARLAAAFAAFDAVGDGCELATVDGARFCVLLPDASQPGRYRWQGFDARGFYTHSTHATPADAVADAARAGFVVPAPGILDRLAAAPAWARGMAAADVMQRHNAGMLSWPDACAELERINAPAAEPVPEAAAAAPVPVPVPVPAEPARAAAPVPAAAAPAAVAAAAAGPAPAAGPGRGAPKRVRAALSSRPGMPRPLPLGVVGMPGVSRGLAGHRQALGVLGAQLGAQAGSPGRLATWCRAGPGPAAAGGRAAAARAPPLPAGTFKDAGTGVSTVLLTLYATETAGA